jgi:ABC-type uncharacterized transport system permease subunit
VLVNTLSNTTPVLLLVLMSVGCFALSEWGWRASLRRYTSASS